MIYITGYTHIPIDIGRLGMKSFEEQKNMTKKDFLIICGDFGGVWNGGNEEKYWIKWLKSKNFTTLFVDGNHENFDMLLSLPTVEFCGGMVHKVDDGIYHLMRGEIYNIADKRIFTFGGAASHDKACRTEGKNWWKAELPSDKELDNACVKLAGADWSVDYVITHCAGSNIQKKFAGSYQQNILTDFFDGIDAKLSYKKWFFGHYHIDKEIDEKHIAVFNDIIAV